MTLKTKKKPPELVVRNGKPAAVILDIEQYEDMLERLEDLEDLRMLEKMRRKTLKFRSLDEFLSEYSPNV